MRDVDEGQPDVLLDLLEFDLHSLAKLQVQRSERLIEQQHAGPVHEGPGQRDALALSARQLRRLASTELLESHHLERFGYSGSAFGTIDLLDAESVLHVVRHAHVREQGVILEDRVHVPVVRGEAANIVAVEFDVPFGRCLESGDHPQARRLPRPGWSEHREELSFDDIQIDPVDRDHVAESLANPVRRTAIRSCDRSLTSASIDDCANRPPSTRTGCSLRRQSRARNTTSARRDSEEARRRGSVPCGPNRGLPRPRPEQRVGDVAKHRRTPIDEGGVELDGCGTGLQARQRVRSRCDPSACLDRHCRARPPRAPGRRSRPSRRRSAFPDSPPRPTARPGSSTRGVLLQVRPSAPAPTAMDASAITASASASVPIGGSFTNSGRRLRAASDRTRAARCSSVSRSRPHDTFGQLALSSIPSTCGSRSSNASRASSICSSAMLASRGPVRGRRARRWAATSAPGLGRPIALTKLARSGSRTSRGLGLPLRGRLVNVPATV